MKKYLIATIFLLSFIVGTSALAASYLLEMWSYQPFQTPGANVYLEVYGDDGAGNVSLIIESNPIATVNQWVQHEVIFNTDLPIIWYDTIFADATDGDVLYVDDVYFGEFTSNCCGNRVIESGEACDDGTNYCSDQCLVLGNSNIGNLVCNDDGTTGTCVCGNGIVELGEECDTGDEPDGDNSDGCTDWCIHTGTVPGVSLCGDGQRDLGEDCDGGDLAGPGFDDVNCIFNEAQLLTEMGIDCDSYLVQASCNSVYPDYCYWDVNICRARQCISVDDADTGNTNYEIPVCGNRKIEIGEDCDDGNNVSGDSCSANCVSEGSYYEVLDPADVGPYQIARTDSGSAWGTDVLRVTDIESTATNLIVWNFAVFPPVILSSDSVNKSGEGVLTVVKGTPAFQITDYEPTGDTVCLDQPIEVITSQRIVEIIPGANIPDLDEYNFIVTSDPGGADDNITADGSFSYLRNFLGVNFIPPAYGYCSDDDSIECFSGDTTCSDAGAGTCEEIDNYWWLPDEDYSVSISTAAPVISINNENLNCDNFVGGICEWSFHTSTYTCNAPEIIDHIPMDGETVCRNAQITIDFDQEMAEDTLLHKDANGRYLNIILNECPGGTCAADPDPLTNIIANQACDNDGLACNSNDDCSDGGRCNLSGIDVVFRRDSTQIRINAYNYGTCQDTGNICRTDTECATSTCENIGTINYLKDETIDGTTYSIFVEGGPFNITNINGIGLAGKKMCGVGGDEGEFCEVDPDCDGTCELFGPDVLWEFSTNENFCECNYVEVEITQGINEEQTDTIRNSDYFTCAGNSCIDDVDPSICVGGGANDGDLCITNSDCDSGNCQGSFPGNQHLYTAQCFDISNPNEEPDPVNADYTWQEYDYSEIIILNELPIPQDFQTWVTPNNKNGDAYVQVTAETNILGFDTKASATVDITNFICNNPWPPMGDPSNPTFPFRDSDDINFCDRTEQGCLDTHFDLLYCRDDGGPSMADDLPALDIDPTVIGRQGSLLKEFFFINRSQTENIVVGTRLGTEFDLSYTPCGGGLGDVTDDGKINCWNADAPVEFAYLFNFPYEGDYQLELTSLNYRADRYQDLSAYGIYHDLDIYIDDETNPDEFRGNIQAAAAATTTSTLFLDDVPAGDHYVLIDWKNDWLFGTEADSNFTMVEIKVTQGDLLANDAIGVRVLSNPNHLNPYTWYLSGTTPSGEICFEGDNLAFISPDRLVGSWQFEEPASSATANDSSGQRNAGDLLPVANPPLRTDGYISKGLQLDGVDDYVRIDDDQSLDIQNNITVSMWFKTNGDTGTDELLITKRDPSIVIPFEIWFRPDGVGAGVDAGPYINFNFTSGGPGTGIGVRWNNNPVDNTWYHVVGTYDGSELRLYIDGNLVDTESFTGLIDTTDQHLSIGAMSHTGINRGFIGTIDDVRIYARAITQEEVTELASLQPCDFNVPNRGTSNITVDNYQAVRDGRTVYVGGTNLDLGLPELYTNIYLMSYNQGASSDTIEIFNRLLDNWNLNNNVDNKRACTVTRENCLNNLDCALESNELSQDDNLVLNMPFFEGQGDRTVDLSGNGKNGDLINMEEEDWSIGRLGYGLEFDGSDEYVEIANDGSLSFGTTDFSLALWLKFPEGIVNPEWSLGKGDAWNTAGAGGYGISHWTTADPISPGFYLNDGTNRFVRYTALINRGEWAHVVWTIDRSTGLMTNYTNGEYVGETNISALGDISINTNTDPLYIGRMMTSRYSGILDEVMIFDRPLSEAEIQDLYFSAGGGVCDATKEKIVRDTKRLGDITDLNLYSTDYQLANNNYPNLGGGTYIQRNTISVWPSWGQTLQPQLSGTQSYSELGIGMPTDPINRIIGCTDPFDQTTCWDETALQFGCPINAYIYAYYSDLQNFTATAYFEYGGPGNWRNTLPNFSQFISDICFNFNVANDNDLDGDGIIDSIDNCPPSMCSNASFCYNPDQTDGDGDGIGEICDSCPTDPDNDTDGDGICNLVDNCPDIYNPDQINSDGVGLGDACDFFCRGDSDSDSICDEEDNCPNVYNPAPDAGDPPCPGDVSPTTGQCNTDISTDPLFSHIWPNGETFGDACDPCTDTDADGRGEPGFNNTCQLDNCSPETIPAITCSGPDPSDLASCPTSDPCCNPNQEDFDSDLTGFICDYCIDVDGDGYGDDDGSGDARHPFTGHNSACTGLGSAPENTDKSQDNCSDVYNPAQIDCDDDLIGDTCDEDNPDSDVATETDFWQGVCVQFPIETATYQSCFTNADCKICDNNPSQTCANSSECGVGNCIASGEFCDDAGLGMADACDPFNCGNGVCDSAEDIINCAVDCSVACVPGTCDDICMPGCGPADDPDCTGTGCCGDGTCDAGESPTCVDCLVVCSTDGSCDGSCPAACTLVQDPDCGCDGLVINNCCPASLSCNNTNDYDCDCVADGIDNIGVSQAGNNTWLFDRNDDGVWGGNPPDTHITYGLIENVTTDIAISGDWDGDGNDQIGIVGYDGTNVEVSLDGPGGGFWSFPFTPFSAFKPVIGDWNGDNVDDFGYFNTAAIPNPSYVLDSNGSRDGVFEDYYSLAFSCASDWPIAGNFGPGIGDEIGLHNRDASACGRNIFGGSSRDTFFWIDKNDNQAVDGIEMPSDGFPDEEAFNYGCNGDIGIVAKGFPYDNIGIFGNYDDLGADCPRSDIPGTYRGVFYIDLDGNHLSSGPDTAYVFGSFNPAWPDTPLLGDCFPSP